MCVAALAPCKAVVPDRAIHQMFGNNMDGAGLAYVRTRNGKPEVVIDKGYWKSADWLAAYKRALSWKDADSPVLLHARIATLGEVTKANCHPFKIKDGALIHNGSFFWGGGINREKSDTREIAERCGNNINYDDLTFDIGKVEKVLGINKVVVLFKDKRYVILNEKKGDWIDGVWYSNTFWVNRPAIPCSSYRCKDRE